MKKWGYTNESVWADLEEGDVWAGDEIAIQMAIEGGALKPTYGRGWEEWLTQDGYPEFPDMVKKLSDKLGRVPLKGVGKGGSKGKPKGKGASK